MTSSVTPAVCLRALHHTELAACSPRLVCLTRPHRALGVHESLAGTEDTLLLVAAEPARNTRNTKTELMAAFTKIGCSSSLEEVQGRGGDNFGLLNGPLPS